MKYDFESFEKPFNRYCDCKEYWKDIDGKYMISNKGRLYSWWSKRFIGSIVINKKRNNRKYIMISGLNEVYMNRLVYYYLVDKDIEGFEIDHFNTNTLHNCICNLEKKTHKENCNNPNTIENLKKIPKKKGKDHHSFGKKLSEKTKKLISDKMKLKPKRFGKNNHRYGKKLSEKTKELISVKMKIIKRQQ